MIAPYPIQPPRRPGMTAPDINIPDEALEAAARADYEKFLDYANEGGDRSLFPAWDDLEDEPKAEAIERARAACLAMLMGWPNMRHSIRVGGGAGGPQITFHSIILPVTRQEHE